jgi:hypothetical protein
MNWDTDCFVGIHSVKKAPKNNKDMKFGLILRVGMLVVVDSIGVTILWVLIPGPLLSVNGLITELFRSMPDFAVQTLNVFFCNGKKKNPYSGILLLKVLLSFSLTLIT